MHKLKYIKHFCEYYLGLDIGTNSVAYAVTDTAYNLKKIHGDDAWGVTVFDEASSNAKRRTYRNARRRNDRKKERVQLLQDLFTEEIEKVDKSFLTRLKMSHLYREEAHEPYSFFCDPDYTDVNYHHQYPTIHHLLTDLMEDPAPHDVRLVYLACKWLITHRGHFWSNVSKDKVGEILDFKMTFNKLNAFLIENEYQIPWCSENVEKIGEALKKREGVKDKTQNLINVMLNGTKPSKEPLEEFPYSLDAVIRLLAGGTCKVKDLFAKDEYEDLGSVSLGMKEDKLAAIMDAIGDDYDLIEILKAVYDWSILSNLLGDKGSISEAKKAVYDQHKQDLALLKYVIHKYCPDDYEKMFRNPAKEDNYTSYVYHSEVENSRAFKKCSGEAEFCAYVSKMVESVQPDDVDKDCFEDMMKRLELKTFMPKQKTTDNGVIPYQLYWFELDRILTNAEKYLPFLSIQDEKGRSVSDKIRLIFLYRIPYFVGPLNEHSNFAWLKRSEGKIYPWNFQEIVDLEVSEERFIRRMTNTCTYLPGEPVLPKDSLCYHKFSTLNELNALTINGIRIPVELKQSLYEDLFLKKKIVTRSNVEGYLISKGIIEKGQEKLIGGIDKEIHANLFPQIAFRKLLNSKTLSEMDVEDIIERSSYSEDKQRLNTWLTKHYPFLSESDRRDICSIPVKKFGRLSKKFLCGIEGTDTKTGETFTIISALWSTQSTLMELLSERYTFKKAISDFSKDYYGQNPSSLEDRLDDMNISNAVRRTIYRTFAVVSDVTKALGGPPKKICIEMARGSNPDQKGKRTKSRKQQILDLYKNCKNEDVCLLKQQLEEMGDSANTKLQADRLFLYYIQFGKCMYTGTPIQLDQLGTATYNIEHIYPRSVVKDDSILNNKVLVLTEINLGKKDNYPISSDIRKKMTPFWKALNKKKLVSDEKLRRLTRSTPFTADERWGFINRQLVETSQSTKAIATLLSEKYPQTEIIYSKAGLVSEFRQEFNLFKSRSYNELHHAVDAYLNVVVGDVYNMRFTKKWFNIKSEYSIKCKAIFTHTVKCGNTIVWDETSMLDNVKKTAVRNTAHFNKYAFMKTGGLFDQLPVARGNGVIQRKKELDVKQYGGYTGASIMFFMPVHYKVRKKENTLILPVELMYGDQFLNDSSFAKNYAIRRIKDITGKTTDEITFPMGKRIWKINSVLSLDGFRVCITGITTGGTSLRLQSMMQFSADPYWIFYIKKLENLTEKLKTNKSYVFSEKYDKINRADNERLYELYIDKLENTIYSKRWNSQKPLNVLVTGKSIFYSLSETKQAEVLLNIHTLFGRVASGSDLSAIGGEKISGATTSFSTTVSNWRKYYKDIRLIDVSPSGLWEKQSENLLDLL